MRAHTAAVERRHAYDDFGAALSLSTLFGTVESFFREPRPSSSSLPPFLAARPRLPTSLVTDRGLRDPKLSY